MRVCLRVFVCTYVYRSHAKRTFKNKNENTFDMNWNCIDNAKFCSLPRTLSGRMIIRLRPHDMFQERARSLASLSNLFYICEYLLGEG